ncbi:hypothetical protein [Pedobacter sp. L105]|uniref:hypothetical protein n=1 Tax=Pedobacter sp. L105 TaxID=1641871 RepID=UPI00131B13F7|nr:hypothetical protein [Pedobacter sp. L105]
MKKYLYIILLMFLATSLHAQSSESTPEEKVVPKLITNEFPATRTLDVQFDQFGDTHYKSEYRGQSYETGDLKSQNRLKVAFNLPLIEKKNWTLSTSFRYKYEQVSFDNINVPSGGMPVVAQRDELSFHYILGSLNYTRNDQLFGTTFTSNFSGFGDASFKSFGRFNATYIGSLVLKNDTQTRMTAGIILQTNPNSISPILPSFSYDHRFSDSLWELDVILPKQIYLRRKILKNDRLSLGTEFVGEQYYFNSNFQGPEKVYNYNRNELKSGLLYEYRITHRFTGLFKTGWNKPLHGTIRERGETDRIVVTKYDPNFYFNFGISFNLMK